MNHAKASACCFRGRRCGDSNTSAERSAAREDGVGPSATFRVASPLVMAMRGSCVECNSVRLTRRWVIASQATTACFAGGSATRNAHRRRSRMLRLRCAPPSARSNVIHARASESGHLKRSFGSAPKRISAPEDSLRGELARARARQEPRSSAQSTSRALVVFAVAAAAAPFGLAHARASKGGGREPQVRPAASCERSN